MILKDSQPNITNNIITDNGGIGVVVRDKSKGNLTKNVISGNELDVFVERKKEEGKCIKNYNKIAGEVRVSQRGGCVFC
jgi:parallel beta-helix repeat protein